MDVGARGTSCGRCFVLAAALVAGVLTGPVGPWWSAARAAEPATMTIHRRAGAVSVRLGNGVTAAVKPMPGAGEVRLAVLIAGGEVLETEATRGATRAAATAWALPALPDDLAAGITISRSLTPEGLSLSLWGKPELLRPMLDAAMTMLREPAVSPGDFASWQEGLRAAQGRPPKPALQIGSAIAALLAPEGDPRAREPGPEQLLAVEREAAAGWLRERVARGPVSVALVGEVTLEDGLRAVGEAFATLAPRPALSVETYAAERDGRGGARGDVAGAGGEAGAGEPGPRRVSAALTGSWPGSPQHAVIAWRVADLSELPRLRGLYVGAELLERRVQGAARDASLGIEHVRAVLLPGRSYRGLGVLMVDARVSASADEAQLRRVNRAVVEAAETLAREAAGAEEFNAVREAALNDLRARLASPAYWSSLLPALPMHGLTADDLVDAPDAYARLTPEAVRDDLKRWITAPGRIELLASPEPGKR